MEFTHPDGRSVPVVLPARSALIMTGESRYIWLHGITPRKSDILPTSFAECCQRDKDAEPNNTDEGTQETAALQERLTLMKRGARTSFTFRKTLADPDNYGTYRTSGTTL